MPTLTRLIPRLLLLSALACTATSVAAQAQAEPPRAVADSAVLIYHAPKTASDTLTAPADTVARHTSFVKRILKYFENANIDKTLTKKFDFSIIGGPNYSSNTGFGIGLVAAGLYRLDRENLTMSPSNTSLYSDISTTGFFMIGIRGNNLFKADKHRLFYNLSFFYKPNDFWGVGYDAATYNDRSEYTRLETDFQVDFSWRLGRHLFLGPTADVDYIIGKKFTHPEYIPAGQGTQYTNVGIGGFLVIDSRDLINNAYRGVYLRLEQRFYPKFIGNSTYFARTEIIADYYHHAWQGAVMAYDVHMQFNRGDAPWTMIAQMGGPYRMRGYYQGRYRDNDIIEIQAEIRQHIHGRNGVAVWVGAGNVFPSISKFNGAHTLPNYGLGYRWEFKKRVNVRLDYGFGKKQSGFIFNINEAF